MTDNPDDLRRMARDFLDTAEGDAVLLAMGRLRKALERDLQAQNSPEAREAAQQVALAADATVAEVLGIAALRRKRMLVELDDQTADARYYRRRIGLAVKDATPKGRIRLRHVVARMVYDLAGIVGNDIANHVAAHMMETAAGRKGLMHAESMQGVDDETAAAFELKRKIIDCCGYTIGQEVSKNRVPPAYWRRAAKVHNALAATLQAGGEKVVTVTAETIRTWCSREGDSRKPFEAARKDGRRDHVVGTVDETRMLRSRPTKINPVL